MPSYQRHKSAETQDGRLAKVLFLCVFMLMPLLATAQDTPNSRQARQIFQHAYDHFYGNEGVSFLYNISILGLYHEEGTAWYKGKKSKSIHGKSIHWNDGKVLYKLRTNKKLVEIHDPKVNKDDQLLQKFKFYPDEFDYHITKEGSHYLVTLKAKKGAKNTKMKEVRALITAGTYYPKYLKIKIMGLFWAKISFKNFKAGNISDSVFQFPKEKYADCRFEDRR